MRKIRFYRGRILMVLLVALLAGCGGGGGGGERNKNGMIYFDLTSYYESISQEKPGMYEIPTGNTVNFYTSITNDEDTFNADYVFTGTTGKGVIKATLPEFLKNQQRYIYAVVNMNGSFDPRGKSSEEIIKAVMEGDILIGQVETSDGENAHVTLTAGVTISGFKLYGKPSGEAVNVINFTIQNIYYGPPPEEGGANPEYSIPPNKTILFYAITEENYKFLDGDENPEKPIYVQLIHRGITNSSTFEEKLPNDLIGQKRHFIALVVIKSFGDLNGMNKTQLGEAIWNGNVLYGKSLKPNSGEIETYSLTLGVNNIGNFEFYGIEIN